MNIKKLIFIIISIILSFYILLLLNINKYKSDINDYLIKNEIKSRSDIEISIFPLPSIKLNNLNYNHDNKYLSEIEIDKLILKPSIAGLIFRNIKFSNISFSKVIIRSDYKFNKKDVIDHYQSITKNQNYDIFNNIYISDLKIKNDNVNKSIDIAELNLSKNNNDIILSLNQKLFNDLKKLNLKIKDNLITANIDSINNKTTLKGVIDKDNIKATVSSNIKYNQNFLNKYNILYNATNIIKFDDDAKINFDIDISLDQTKINNLSVNSRYVDLGGEIHIDHKEITDILFNINSLKIDNILAKQSADIIYNDKSEYNIFSENDLKLSVQIKDGMIFDHTISDSNINLNIIENNLKINSSNIIFDENNNLEFEAKIDDNKFRKALDGKIKFTGKNVYLKNILKNNLDSTGVFTADIFLTQKEIRLSNIKHDYDKTSITGNVLIKSEDSLPYYDIDLKMNNLYLEDKSIDDLFGIINRSSTSESNNLNKISEFQSLRMIDSKINLDLNINSLYIADNKYESIKTELNLDKGLLIINNFKIKSDIIGFTAKASINSKLIDPMIDINLYGEMINFDKILSLVKNNINIDIKSILSSSDLANAKCNLELNLNNIIYDQNNYHNVVISSVLDKNNIIISKLDMKLLDASLISKGNISINPFTIGMSFAFNNFPSDILSYFGIDYYNGHFSANGSFASSLENKKNFIKNLQSNLQIVSRDMIINNFNIDKIINSTLIDKIHNKSEISELISNYRIGSTKINQFNAKLMIKNGIVQSNSISLLNDRFSGIFGGNIIDLNNNITNSVLKIGFIPKPRSKQLDLTININGPLDNMVVKPDFNQVEQYLKQQNNDIPK